MPVQKTQSQLLAKLGDRLAKAHEEHKADETTYSEFGELPEGIEGGIAQLVDCKFTQVKEGKQNAGQYMFYAAGIVKSPQEVNGTRIEGLRTQISEPLFDTPTRTRKTVSEHVAHVYNELRKLGVDTANMDIKDLEPTAAKLTEIAPHFKFRTWKGEKAKEGQYKDQEPRVQHQWNGLCDYTANGDESTSGVQDNSPPSPRSPAQGTQSPSAEASSNGNETTSSADTTTTPDDVPDIDALLEAAQGGDEEAQSKLLSIAEELGVHDEATAADDWPAVVDIINNAATPTEEGGEAPADEGASSVPDEPEKPWEPTKGDVVFFTLIDPKTKKPVKDGKTKKEKPPVEVEVTAVDKKTKTATILRLDDKKTTYTKVKWDELIVS